MSLILFATLAAIAAAGSGYFAARRATRREAEQDAKPLPPAPSAPDPASERLRELPLAVGDVVSVEADDPERGAGTSKSHVERWLAGALVAIEDDVLIGAVFIAPEGAREEAVLAYPSPRREIGWLSPVALEIGIEPPTSLEIGGVVMQRRRRLFVSIQRLGAGAPRLGERGIWAEYQATGRAVGLVIRGDHSTMAWSGTRFDAGEYDRMGSGEAA